MTIQGLITQIASKVLSPLIPILIGVAMVVFFWGLVKYIYGGAKEVKEARDLIFWGVITLFAMVSIWGIVSIIQYTFFGSTSVATPPDVPRFNASTPGTSESPD